MTEDRREWTKTERRVRLGAPVVAALSAMLVAWLALGVREEVLDDLDANREIICIDSQSLLTATTGRLEVDGRPEPVRSWRRRLESLEERLLARFESFDCSGYGVGDYSDRLVSKLIDVRATLRRIGRTPRRERSGGGRSGATAVPGSPGVPAGGSGGSDGSDGSDGANGSPGEPGPAGSPAPPNLPPPTQPGLFDPVTQPVCGLTGICL